MKTSAFIFDLDGVLVFTDRFHYLAWKRIADEIGIGFDETINNRLRGVSRMESLNIILKNAGFILDKTGLREHFDAVSDGNNITKSKPDPEVFLKAAEYLNIDPLECIVVEDAAVGIDAAKNAGMRAAGIGDAASYKRADWHLNAFGEILNIEV